MPLAFAIIKERAIGERRVAASPETVAKLVAAQHRVYVEHGAGFDAGFDDGDYEVAGATLAAPAAAINNAQIVLKVAMPLVDEVALFAAGQVIVCNKLGVEADAVTRALIQAGVSLLTLERLPRITRAQTMDALSSQANLSGYKAILEAAAHYHRSLPMMMTAAGTVPAARVFVMGVGVAGLQAIATARRLGAIVWATDVRPNTKEEVESLGARFVAVEDEEFTQAQTAGGYAKEMSAAYQEKQRQLIADTVAKQDIIVTTALIPGRPAPKLVSADMVATMKRGSVIVDLAAETGGNCELCVCGQTVTTDNGVIIVGCVNMPSRLADTASRLYARNVLAFVNHIAPNGELNLNTEDEIINATLVAKDGVWRAAA